MKTNISNWGNSLGIRIPKSFSESMGIISGSEVEIELQSNKLIISSVHKSLKKMAKNIDLESMVEKVTPENMHSLSDDTPVGNEIW